MQRKPLTLACFLLGCSAAGGGQQLAAGGEGLRLATFNLQNFGRSKVELPGLMAELVDVLRRYPFVAVQELSDASEQAPRALLERLNAEGADYAVALSQRSGREPDDDSYREQYGFYYDRRSLSLVGDGRLYDDSAYDHFVREPYLAHFAARSGFDFVAITVHTRPVAALEELAHLTAVVEWAQSELPDARAFIILGDLNASCGYASSEELDRLALRHAPYRWLVPDDADTTTSASHCAYDRIIFGDTVDSSATGAWGIDTALDPAISDHFPVWAELWTGQR
ncbi:MAG TPA: endonuclease/exonuclease/phosphatase family protein [Polyangiaceae bacterium]